MKEIKVYRATQEHREKMNQIMTARSIDETGNQDFQFKGPMGPLVNDLLYIYLAEYDGELSGWISTCIIPKANDKLGTLYIDELWVKKEHRRNGIAEALMKEAIGLAKEKRMWKIRLVVGDGNELATRFYKKMGFSLDPVLFGEMSV